MLSLIRCADLTDRKPPDGAAPLRGTCCQIQPDEGHFGGQPGQRVQRGSVRGKNQAGGGSGTTLFNSSQWRDLAKLVNKFCHSTICWLAMRAWVPEKGGQNSS